MPDNNTPNTATVSTSPAPSAKAAPRERTFNVTDTLVSGVHPTRTHSIPQPDGTKRSYTFRVTGPTQVTERDASFFLRHEQFRVTDPDRNDALIKPIAPEPDPHDLEAAKIPADSVVAHWYELTTEALKHRANATPAFANLPQLGRSPTKDDLVEFLTQAATIQRNNAPRNRRVADGEVQDLDADEFKALFGE